MDAFRCSQRGSEYELQGIAKLPSHPVQFRNLHSFPMGGTSVRDPLTLTLSPTFVGEKGIPFPSIPPKRWNALRTPFQIHAYANGPSLPALRLSFRRRHCRTQ